MPRFPVNNRQRSIKSKVAVTTLTTVSIVMICLSWALFSYFRGVLRESIFKQQFALVTEIARELEGRVELARFQLMLAATDITPETLADPAKTDLIMKHNSPLNMIFDSGFLIIGKNGRVISQSLDLEDLAGMDLSQREYVLEALRSGKPYLSKPFRCASPPHIPMIAMVYPVRDNDDSIICLLAGYHALGDDKFLTALSSQSLDNAGYLYLFHGRTIIMHPDKSRIMLLDTEGRNAGVNKALEGFEGSMENINSRGEHVLSSFKRVGGTPWILGTSIPRKQAFSALDTLKLYAGIIVAVGIMLSILSLWYLTGRLTRPILLLTSHLDRSRDDPSGWQPLELRTDDEIERLADTFNTLMNQVHETKQQLQDENAFFSTIIQDAAAPMLVIDRNHRVIFWNSALALLTGKSSAEMIGTNDQWTPFYKMQRPLVADLVIDHTVERADEFYSIHSQSQYLKDSLKAEGWYENLGGKRRYIFFEAAPVRNRNNEIIAAVETIEDITDRKLAEEAAASYTLFLREIMDAIPDPVYYKNSAGAYLGCNAAFKDFFGKTEDEIIGYTILDIMPESYSEKSLQMDINILDTSDSLRFETELLRGDGAVRSALANKAPFSNPDGSIAGIVGTFVDITERKEIEIELINSRMELEVNHLKMADVQRQVFQQEKMASIGQLAAGVAHEINNPMGFISSNLSTLKKYLELLIEYINAGDTAVKTCCSGESEKLDELRKRLKIDYIKADSGQLIAESEEGAVRVRQIVQDLMKFSRVDKNETVLANLNESLATTINVASSEIRYIASVIREFGIIPEIRCFPQQLNQVFLNLLINAAHAVEEMQGSITLRTWSDDAHVFVSVADTGCGIEEEFRQRIFEPFFTTKEVGKGTGLGLSISYDIIRKHGGEIRVESEIGKGTTFTVKLPIDGPPQVLSGLDKRYLGENHRDKEQ